MTAIDLLKDNERRVFFHYLIPSICSTLVSAIYILIDTLVIGNGVSAEGISALNVCLPLYSLYMGIGLMFGVGGGILFSSEEGTGDTEKANKYLAASMIGVIIVTILITAVLALNLKDVLYLLGANDNSIDLVMEYGKYVVYCGPIFTCSYFLGPIVRNKKDPKLCMKGVLVGAVLNIVLDYLFVYPMDMGMTGAAIASVMSSLTTLLILLTHFRKKENRIKISAKGLSFNDFKQIVTCGSSSFLMEVATGFVILVFNIQILKHIGGNGVVIYGVISNCMLVGTALFNGVAQAGQPIISTNYGANKIGRVKSVLKYAVVITMFISIILYLITTIFTKDVISIFMKVNDDLMNIGVPAVRMYLSCFCLMGVNVLLCNYFQSVGREKVSVIISIVRGFLLNIILVVLMPSIFGGNSLWIVVPITEMITFMGIGIYYVTRRKALKRATN